MTPRRQLTVAVVACAAAAGLALFSASRPWLVEATVRPEPLPAVTTVRSGGSLAPSLPALGWVALAAAGALLATRGRARMALGLLVVLVGLAMPVVVLATAAAVSGDAPAAGGPTASGPAAVGPAVVAGWRLAAMVAGVAVAAVGVATIRWGRSWPALGSRYERAAAPGAARPDLWDALDRGEDPTRV